MKYHRLTRDELNDLCENYGLTNRQKEIAKLKLFAPDEPSVVSICHKLHIGNTTYARDMSVIRAILNKYFSL